MSIDPRRDRKQYELKFEGSRADFEALADVLDKAIERFNVDLYPNQKDIPGRISLEQGTAFQFSRVKKALEELSIGLKDESTNIDINLGDINTKEGKLTEPKEEHLGLMDSVTDSRRIQAIADAGGNPITSVGTPIRDMMLRQGILERKSMAEGDSGRVRLLDDAHMRWIYAESLVGPEVTSSKKKIKSMKALEKLDAYPPKLNKKQRTRLRKMGFNRAYIVMMEVDNPWVDLSESVHTKPGGWDKVLRGLSSGRSILKRYEGAAPKTVGDVYVRIAAYAAGRGFGMNNVVVMPFDVSEMGTMPLVGKNDKDKIYARPNVLSTRKIAGESYPIYRNFMAFLVVGRGPYKPVGLTREKEKKSDDITLPDL